MRKLLLIVLLAGLGHFEVYSQPYSYSKIEKIDSNFVAPDGTYDRYVYDITMNNLSSGEQEVVIDSGPDCEYTWDQTGTWFILRDKAEAILYNFLEDKKYYLGEEIIQFGKILYSERFNRIYILSSYRDPDSAMITYFDLIDQSLNELQQLPSVSEVTPFENDEAFLSEDETVIYYHTEDLDAADFTSNRDLVTSFSTVNNQVIESVELSSLSNTHADVYILNSGLSGKSVISSYKLHTDKSFYQLYDFDSGHGYAIIKYLHHAKPLFTRDGKYLFLAQTYKRDYQYFCNGKVDVFNAQSGKHLKSITIAPDAELFMYRGYDNQIFVSYTDSLSFDSYIIDPEDLFMGDLKIDSISPSLIVTKMKKLSLTVYGSNFSKKSEVYFNGKKQKTKFISENELEAEIKDKDIKKEGTYSVHVAEKKIGRTEQLEFKVYKELPERLVPVLNCVEDLEGKKSIAWFSYENYNDGTVFIEGKENEIKGGKKPKGKDKEEVPPVIFLPGVHEKVFSVEFDDKKKLKWELLKEKAEVKEDTPPCR
jgi:hypothetical protein